MVKKCCGSGYVEIRMILVASSGSSCTRWTGPLLPTTKKCNLGAVSPTDIVISDGVSDLMTSANRTRSAKEACCCSGGETKTDGEFVGVVCWEFARGGEVMARGGGEEEMAGGGGDVLCRSKSSTKTKRIAGVRCIKRSHTKFDSFARQTLKSTKATIQLQNLGAFVPRRPTHHLPCFVCRERCSTDL